jgi:nicotinamide-nucleotide amidase
LSAVPGASNYFKGSVVSYATQVKIDVLDIDENLIAKHGVVSAEVAKEMAKSVQKVMNSDCAIATTGNAGPTKGDEDAELGTVFIGIAMYNEVFVEEFNFGQPREKVIDRGVSKALELIYKEILKK